MAEVDELGDDDRLDMANAPGTEALAIEFLARRLGAEMFRRRVPDAAMDTTPARRRRRWPGRATTNPSPTGRRVSGRDGPVRRQAERPDAGAYA